MVTTLLGLLLPGVATVLYFSLAIYQIAPFRAVAHLVFGRGVQVDTLISASGRVLPPSSRAAGNYESWQPANRRLRIHREGVRWDQRTLVNT